MKCTVTTRGAGRYAEELERAGSRFCAGYFNESWEIAAVLSQGGLVVTVSNGSKSATRTIPSVLAMEESILEVLEELRAEFSA